MNRASPVDLYKAMDLAQSFSRSGILFVPVPVICDSDRDKFGAIAIEQMAKIEDECEVILTIAR